MTKHEQFPVAPHFSRVSTSFNEIAVMPPYELRAGNSGGAVGYARGNLRVGGTRGPHLVVTGPKMEVTYSGCRWNKLVFSHDMENTEMGLFVEWLSALMNYLEPIILAEPDVFKPGTKSGQRFVFDKSIIKNSNKPNLYMDELRCRLATKRVDQGNGMAEDQPITQLIVVDESGAETFIDPADIRAGSSMIPIFRVGYSRNNDIFEIQLTLLKARYFPVEQGTHSFMDYTFDDAMEV